MNMVEVDVKANVESEKILTKFRKFKCKVYDVAAPHIKSVEQEIDVQKCSNTEIECKINDNSFNVTQKDMK